MRALRDWLVHLRAISYELHAVTRRRYVISSTKARQLSRRICHAVECRLLSASKWLIAADSSDQVIGSVHHTTSPTRRPADT